MKYTGQYWIMIAPFMKRLLAKKYGRKAAGEYIKNAKPIYRQMLSQAAGLFATTGSWEIRSEIILWNLWKEKTKVFVLYREYIMRRITGPCMNTIRKIMLN